MIDWLSIRTPINSIIYSDLAEKFMSFIGQIEHKDSDGNLVRTKYIFDVDKIRSDSQGLFWNIENNQHGMFLKIGASPASLEYNNNIFGSDDIRHCAAVLIKRAEKDLNMPLPPPIAWECRRIDITENYLLDDNKQVKQALRELRHGDGSRQKAYDMGGDTVGWGQGSDYVSGKAYDKGTQAEYLDNKSSRKGKSKTFNDYTLNLLKRLLRLELSLKRQWCDKFATDWLSFTSDFLKEQHRNYFNQFIGKLEVKDMENFLHRIENIAPTKGQALSAHRTWALIKAIGYEQAKSSMPKRTFMRHQKLLKLAGLSSADLQSATVLQFRQKTICISSPIRTWDELLSAA